MECAFHPLFSLTSGTCRLDYRRPENRWVSWGTGVSRCVRAMTGNLTVFTTWTQEGWVQGWMDWASLGLHLSLLEVSLISHFIIMGSVYCVSLYVWMKGSVPHEFKMLWNALWAALRAVS